MKRYGLVKNRSKNISHRIYYMPSEFKIIIYLIFGVVYFLFKQYQKNEAKEQKDGHKKSKKPASWRDLIEGEKNDVQDDKEQKISIPKVQPVAAVKVSTVQPKVFLNKKVQQSAMCTQKIKSGYSFNLKKAMIMNEVLGPCRGL